jgi:hypothetical protein
MTYWELSFKCLVQRCVAPTDVVCPRQEAHQKEDAVLVEDALRLCWVSTRESFVLGVLRMVSLVGPMKGLSVQFEVPVY